MPQIIKSTTRRQFITRTTLAAGALALPSIVTGRVRGANNRLNIACIGVGNRGGNDMDGVAHENIVALCDIDEAFLGAAAAKHPKAAKFNDYRKMLDAMHNEIDAVVVATPDHTHAPATVRALRDHKHVYCEKPLTHTVAEARLVTQEAIATKAVTQMGTQIHAGDNYRRVVEVIQSGAIGKVSQVHTWVPTTYHGGNRPDETPPIPKTVHWDLWLGTAPARPYHSAYHPFNWRGWWDFGGGALADMACHHMDLPFWALGLRYPKSIQAKGPDRHDEGTPQWLVVDYEFPADESDYVADTVNLTWHHGGKRPPQVESGQAPDYRAGNLFIGDKGMLIADYGRHQLLPENKFTEFQRPDHSIPRSIGHHREWTEACKANDPEATTCRFPYAGPLTEAVLLGNVSFRIGGKKLQWDARALRAVNAPEADEFIAPGISEGVGVVNIGSGKSLSLRDRSARFRSTRTRPMK